MEVLSVLAVIAAIIGLGFLSEQIFKKTNVPDVLILIFVGIIIAGIGWARADDFGDGSRLFTTFALVFILFQGAMNIDFKELLASLSKTVYLTILSFILTLGIVTAVASLLGHDLMVSLLIGTILGGTSSAVVIPLVKNLDAGKSGTVLTLESAISDVLCIVGAITVIGIFETGSAVPSEIFQTILSSFSLALVLGLAIGLVWILILNKYATLADAYMVSVALVIALYAFVESPFVNASGAIAALAFGLILGNSEGILKLIRLNQVRKQTPKEKLVLEDPNLTVVRDVLSPSARNFYSEIGFFVKVFFFVYLGILIDFTMPMAFLYGAILTLAIFLIRPLAVKLAFRKDKLPVKEKALLEVLIPKGLAAAVLAQLALQSGIPGAGEVVNIVLSVVLLSIIFTSILAFMASKGWFTGSWDLFRKA